MATTNRFANPVLFVCDMQEKFRPAIYEFPKLISTAGKMIKAAKILNIPIFLTTQNASRLGATVPEILSLLPSDPPTDPSQTHSTNPPTFLHDKMLFSMLTPTLMSALLPLSSSSNASIKTSVAPLPLSIILLGIETHVCITQTTLDLLAMGHKVYVLQDGVSSVNNGERKVALARLAREGATVTTSESVLFEIMRDAKGDTFKSVSGVVKEGKEGTREAVETFCS